MKIETKLFEECKAMAVNCSITYQKINDYSIEIYTGYKSSYQQLFFTDGHIEAKTAIKEALKFMRAFNCRQRLHEFYK